MSTDETAKTPSLCKTALLFIATAAMVMLSNRAPAQEPSSSPRAFASEPKVRVRDGGDTGLNPVAFADRIAAHRDIHGGNAMLFFQGDADHDSHISPPEPKEL